MINLILYPSSYFDINKVDEDLKTEYEAAKETGLFEMVLFGYDRFIQEGKLTLSKPIEERGKTKAIYRGWMMKPEQYRVFYEGLNALNIELITPPSAYEKMHVFPNIYQAFGDDTAKMMVFPLHEQINVEVLKKNFDRFMVKDYVKSVKGTSFPKYFDRSISQEEFDKWMEVFYEYRGDLLTGGICIKEYFDLKKYDGRTNEYRVFYIRNQITTVSRNSAQASFASTVPMELVEKYSDLDSPYYTVDFAELDDGSWRVIEAGDGSVSGLSENQDVGAYYRALYHCLN